MQIGRQPKFPSFFIWGNLLLLFNLNGREILKIKNFKNMKKTDLVLAAIIGFLDGVFFYFILKTAEVEIPYTWSLPFALALLCLAGMYFASAVAAKIRVILQVARFFLVGTLNTFIDLGVLNILIWISGIATGIFYSIFKAVSFFYPGFMSMPIKNKIALSFF